MALLVFPQEQTVSLEQVGGKAYHLFMMHRNGLPVPPWFVVTPDAFTRCFNQDMERSLHGALLQGNDAAVQGILQCLLLDSALRTEIKSALLAMCPNGEYVAVRSSAVDEDGKAQSFAGQLESHLYVKPDAVAQAIIHVWQSAFSPTVLSYRKQHGLSGLPKPPAVLIQRMIDAEVSGVAFSVDPVSCNRQMAVVSALWGLGTALVSGECDADTFYIDTQYQVVNQDIAEKNQCHCYQAQNGSGQVVTATVPPDKATQPTLNTGQIQAIAEVARFLESLTGTPQDVEWAIAQNQLFLLQCRPITTLPDPEAASGTFITHFENDLILESWNGVVLPSTFSVIRPFYNSIFRQFQSLTHRQVIQDIAFDPLYDKLMGYIAGRVYLNQAVRGQIWSRSAAFVLFSNLVDWASDGPAQSPAEDQHRFTMTDRIWAAVRLFWDYQGLDRKIAAFQSQADQLLAFPCNDEQQWPELNDGVRRIIQFIQTQWGPPVLNDYFANLSQQLLANLLKKWQLDPDGTLQHYLLAYDHPTVSHQANSRLNALAVQLQRHPDWIPGFLQGDATQIEALIAQDEAISEAMAQYLAQFGDRCYEDLKLESKGLDEDPVPLYRMLGQLAQLPEGPVDHFADLLHQFNQARQTLRKQAKPHQAWLILLIAAVARKGIYHRENLRLHLSRIFGRLRRIYRQWGERLHQCGVLESPADIHYLEYETVLDFVEGGSPWLDFKELVRLRKATFDRFQSKQPPSDELMIKGVVSLYTLMFRDPDNGEAIRGTGCSAGVVQGPVRHVTDLSQAQLQPGEILVAKTSDPAYTILYPVAAGALFEKGNPLSHAAIVAREMGLPVIVSIPNVMNRLQNGEWIEINGQTGVITKLPEPPKQP